MSNQSGITADQEVLNAIAALKSRHASVVAKIEQSEQPVIKLQETFQDLESLREYVGSNDDTPLYIIIYDEPKMHFIAYTPDYAPIRSKMLYASSKITFQRQIGANNLKSYMFTDVNDIDEKSWTDTTSKEELMTAAELEKLQIDAQQNSMRSSGAVRLVSAHTNGSNSLGFKVADAGSLKDLFQKYNLVLFQIDMKSEEIIIKDKFTTSTDDEIVEKIPNDSPTFSIFRKAGDYYFILSCPSGSAIKERMVYAANKRAFILNLKDSDDIDIKKTIEIGDPQELELSDLGEKEETAGSQTPAKPRLNKPKAPSRRR